MSIKPITTTFRVGITRLLIIRILKCYNSFPLEILTARNLATFRKILAQIKKEIIQCGCLMDSTDTEISSRPLLVLLSLQWSWWLHFLKCTETGVFMGPAQAYISSRTWRARHSHEMFEKFTMEMSDGWQAARKLWVKRHCMRGTALNSKWDRAIQLS